MIESIVSQQIASDRLRTELVRKVASKMNLPEEAVEKIIIFQFADLRAATNEFSVLEVSRLCKLMVSVPKMKKMERDFANTVEKLTIAVNNESLSELKKKKAERQLKSFTESLEYLRSKYREPLPPTKHKENNQKRKKAQLESVGLVEEPQEEPQDELI